MNTKNNSKIPKPKPTLTTWEALALAIIALDSLSGRADRLARAEADPELIQFYTRQSQIWLEARNTLLALAKGEATTPEAEDRLAKALELAGEAW
jgi:hypothetical protein